MALDTTSGNAALKIRYAKGLQKVLYDDPKCTPFYSRLSRTKGNLVDSAFGQSFIFPIKYNDPQTSYVDFATGNTVVAGSTGQSRYTAFTVTPVLRYGHARVSGPAMVQSESKGTAAFVDLGAEELDGQLRNLQRQLAITAFRDGFAARGRISDITATTITLTNREDIVNFEQDQLIVASATNSGGVLRATANTGNRITAVNPSTGVLTVATDATATWSNGSGGDFLFLYKDREDAATPTRQVWAGVGAWIPDTAPSSGESFFGVDRSGNPRLHGHRYDGSGDGNKRDALIKASAYFYNVAGSIEDPHCWMNPIDYAALCVTLEAAGAKQYKMEGTNAKISFSAIDVMGMGGSFPVSPDPTCPKGKAYLLSMATWKILYAGDDVAHVISNDGLVYRMLTATSDNFQADCRTISNIVCERPSDNLVITALP